MDKRLEFKAFGGMNIDGEGIFDAHASVFKNIDRDDDIMMPGAFTKTLLEQETFPVLKMHDPNQVVGVSRPFEDKRGLKNVGEIAIDTQIGAETFKFMQMGAMTDWSIGYYPIKFGFDKRKGKDVRLLHEVKLIETSILTKGMAANPKAVTQLLKMRNGEISDPWGEDTENILFMAMKFPKADGWTQEKAVAWIKSNEPGIAHSGGEPDDSTHKDELADKLAGFKFA